MKVINKMMAIILLSGTGIGSVQAQDTTPQTWTLRQCIDYAIEHNIDIRQTANEAEQNKISVNTAKWASAELKWWYQPGVELGTYSFSER